MKRAALPLALLVGVALVVFSFVPREPEANRSWAARATTYSPGPWGTKALFLLFNRIGINATRLRRSTYEQLSPDTVLWVLSREPFGRAERRELERFLDKGGTVIAPPQTLAVVLEEAHLGKPEPKEQAAPLLTAWGMRLDLDAAPVSIVGAASPVETYATTASGIPVVAAWKIGEGRAVSLGIDQLTQNSRIGRAAGGAFLGRLALTLGRKHVFDEFKAGFGEESLVMLLSRVPYRWGIAQLALVGVVGLLSFGRRRLPAEPPGRVRRRRTLDHVEAVARLWQQAEDAGLPLQAILSAVAERARSRLGGAGKDQPFIEWIAAVRPELSSRAKDAWERAERLCTDLHPPPEDARRAAVDIKKLEREGLRW